MTMKDDSAKIKRKERSRERRNNEFLPETEQEKENVKRKKNVTQQEEQ